MRTDEAIGAKVERHYVGESGKAYQEGKRAVPAQGAEWMAEVRARKFQPHIKPTDTVFEFGAGFGWNLISLQCGRKVAYDVSGYRCDGIEWVSGVASLADGFADVVLCHHVLEHVINPADTLATLRRLITPSGKLLLFVPYEAGWRYYHYWANEPNHHLFSWNAQTLGNLVTECGFTVESASIGPASAEPAKLAARLRLGRAGFRALSFAKRLLHRVLEVRIVARVS